MRFFKRSDGGSAPADFWTWWHGGASERVAGAIVAGSFDQRLVEEISRAVRTIHPSMAWELAPGRSARHAFCVSPEGNAELRQLAIRWLETAPPPDATWEYHASKQPSPELRTLQMGPWEVDLAETRAITSWDDARRRHHVRLWHPRFAELPEAARMQLGFVFLDNLLGEEDVERWIGRIDLLDAPTGGRTPDELRAEIARRKVESSGAETWILGDFVADDGSRTVVTADASLKRIDHPFHDTHVTIAVMLDGNDWPTDDLAAELNAEEDDLLGRMGDAAIYAGRTTMPGMRAMHFVTEDLERMKPAIDAWAGGLPPRRIKIEFERDMDWAFQAELGLR